MSKKTEFLISIFYNLILILVSIIYFFYWNDKTGLDWFIGLFFFYVMGMILYKAIRYQIGVAFGKIIIGRSNAFNYFSLIVLFVAFSFIYFGLKALNPTLIYGINFLFVLSGTLFISLIFQVRFPQNRISITNESIRWSGFDSFFDLRKVQIFDIEEININENFAKIKSKETEQSIHLNKILKRDKKDFINRLNQIKEEVDEKNKTENLPG